MTLLIILLIIYTALLLIGSLSAPFTIGKPRKPYTPGYAGYHMVFGLAVTVLLIAAIVSLLRVA